ncbi:MAG: hypothetical protein GTO24_08245, partial [candidate division Zixibacteria bacterium]|nr:hypothetical protein [candidate division Zixibacteria bacterium]
MRRRIETLFSISLIAVFFLLTGTQSAQAAVAVDNVSTGTTDGGSSITISHTTAGSDRLMLVGVSINNDGYETVTDVRYNGVP